ncbi:hypothetical protein [Neobacillus niacini]|uniref:hypothetical protein n=1 Tax=Neobacillus niacini TaxID=86668 RepID=UPI00286737A8|nr:hypothetical protein [Neobacillus niacini]MDR6998855.1 hypothetical protein [Neobacillus niacini]
MKKKLMTTLLTATILCGIGSTYFHVSASDSKYDQLPKEKKEIQERKDINKLRAKNDNITKKDSKNGPLVVQHDREVTTQLLNHIEDPFNDQTIKFTNGWISTVKNNEMNGRIVTVEAGSLIKDPSQGIVIVMIDGASRKFQGVKTYKTPEKHGAVKIIGYNGFNIKLKAKDGKVWTFNVPSGKFQNSN